MACTIELGKYLGYRRLSLDKAVEKFDLFRQISHHALHDAFATSQLLRHYLSENPVGVREYLSLKIFNMKNQRNLAEPRTIGFHGGG